jgi:hypothetical protein
MKKIKNITNAKQAKNKIKTEETRKNNIGENIFQNNSFGLNNNDNQKNINNYISQNNINNENNKLNYNNYNNNNYNNLIQEENNNNEQKLNLVLIYLDISNLLPIFKNNNISFNDIFLLSKSDLIELGLTMMQRNRILKFIELFQNNAIDYSIEEINNFFQKNKNLNIRNIQNINNYNFTFNIGHYNNNRNKNFYNTYDENNDLLNKKNIFSDENYEKQLKLNNKYNNIKLDLKENNKRMNQNYNTDNKDNNNLQQNDNDENNNNKLNSDLINNINNKNKIKSKNKISNSMSNIFKNYQLLNKEIGIYMEKYYKQKENENNHALKYKCILNNCERIHNSHKSTNHKGNNNNNNNNNNNKKHMTHSDSNYSIGNKISKNIKIENIKRLNELNKKKEELQKSLHSYTNSINERRKLLQYLEEDD